MEGLQKITFSALLELKISSGFEAYFVLIITNDLVVEVL